MKKFIFGVILTFLYIVVVAQDNGENTLSMQLTIPQAEEIFLENNLQLIAEKQNIEISKAEIIQAKAWPNPEVGIEIAMYDNQDNIWFRTDTDAQRVVDISQMIETAGKRRKRTNIAKIEAEITEYEFYNTLRELRSELRTELVELHYAQQKADSYLIAIEPVEKLVEVYKEQAEKGNVARAELVRLKALLLDARKGWLDIVQESADIEAHIKMLLNVQPNVSLDIIIPTIQPNDSTPNPELWSTLAQDHRVDFKIENIRLNQSAESLALAKAEAVPDLHIGTMYDRRGAHQSDYWALQIAFDLPVWDRNKGGIQAARIEQEQQQVKLNEAEKQLTIDVYTAAQKLNQVRTLYEQLDPELSSEMKEVMNSVTRSYQSKQLSLLEFIDFFESYRDNLGQWFDTEMSLFNAQENVNYTVGKDIYPIQ
ncbi:MULTISPECIES: TolC family protein [Flammeovirga]|uniref:TolC family protein n=1 Tax=Flammeovirga agarivorans TaxID=2726742 RepID=A0A7X8SN35_9BACT|nr:MULTISPECIES: TolC family protein [Flammeovirga]NLR93261.1 TolC family protein [Flammeovirga agarivorans]